MARERKRSSFTARDPDFAAKLEMTPTTAASGTSALVSSAAPSPEVPDVKEPATTPKRDLPMEVPAPSRDIQVEPSSQNQKSKKSVQHGIFVRINFFWHQELIDRAAVMARDSRCPVRTVLLRIWSEAKDELVREMEEGIPFADIPSNRVQGTSERFDSRLQISEAVHTRLKAEIDPNDIVGLSGPLSRWVREKIDVYASDYLTKAGY